MMTIIVHYQHLSQHRARLLSTKKQAHLLLKYQPSTFSAAAGLDAEIVAVYTTGQRLTTMVGVTKMAISGSHILAVPAIAAMSLLGNQLMGDVTDFGLFR